MLDQDTINQLKTVFAPLDQNVILRYDESSHADQKDLIEMLEDVSKCSSHIIVEKSEKTSPIPRFEIHVQGKPQSITFRGIPGGHEFSSLLLAILNSNHKGKLPDQGIIKRIQALKGPIRLKTYISLSCENCPDVVQAFNLMSVFHYDFHHTMIDGAYAQDEVDELKIQGVPSVIVDGKLFHSGKAQFAELLSKLEKHYGTNASLSSNEDLGQFDIVVIGGGPAGASSAIYSVRKGLKTALIAERMGGQVKDTMGIENLISVPYTEGPQLAANLSVHIAKYPVSVFEHRRVKNIGDGELKKITLESGESLTTKAVIIATGAKWRELNVPGEKEYLGRGVAFCPHCDGPYYKGKDIAVVGGGNSGVEAAIDLAGIVRNVTLLEFAPELKADAVLVTKLKSLPNVKIITNAQTKTVIGDGTKVNALEYIDRVTEKPVQLNLDGVFVQIGLVPNSQFVKDKLELTKFGEIKVDEKGRTSVKGIYAAGDVTTTPYKQIIISMGEGAKAALAAFEDQMLH